MWYRPSIAADRAGYVDLVTGPMLQAAAPYARWIDVFCEPNSPHAFDGDEARQILKAGAAAGLGLRVHGNQLGPGPGVQLAVELGAASVDHCTYLDAADVDALADGAEQTVATLLPGVEFCTRSPYPDAARLLAAGASIALATDCNPGHLLLELDAMGDLAGRSRDGPDPGSGTVRRYSRLGEVAAP